jgi:hypothetical protein
VAVVPGPDPLASTPTGISSECGVAEPAESSSATASCTDADVAAAKANKAVIAARIVFIAAAPSFLSLTAASTIRDVAMAYPWKCTFFIRPTP